MIELPLLKIPYPNWEKMAKKLLEDPYVRKKCERKRRLKEKLDYINTYCEEIKERKSCVLDLGPGPGEFLEFCRYFGNKVYGIDAKFNDFGGMGEEYLHYSKLMTDRQHIPVLYKGVDNLLETGGLPFSDEMFHFINSQGSITYMLNKYIRVKAANTNLKLHEQSSVFYWNDTRKVQKILDLLFKEANRILIKGGILLIYANQPKGEKNLINYRKLILDNCTSHGFKLILEKFKCLHKMEKI